MRSIVFSILAFLMTAQMSYAQHTFLRDDATFALVGPTNSLNSQTSNYTIAPSDCGSTIQAGTGSTGFFTITVPSISGFLSTCVVTIFNGDTGRGKAISGDPGCAPQYLILWPLQACTIAIVNGAWKALIVPGRWQLTSTVTLFADSTNGTDTPGATDCLATGTAACHTITYAARFICDDMDMHGNQVNITPPLGATHTENVSLCNYILGTSNANINNPQILGNPSAPNTYQVTASSGVVIAKAEGAAPWTFNGISIGGGTPTIVIEADINTDYRLKNVILLNSSSITLQSLYGGKIEVVGPVTLSMTAIGAVVDTEFGGQFLVNSQTITCTQATAISGAFAQAFDGGLQSWGTATFSGCGAVTGTRFVVQTNSVIDTNNSGANFLPGNAAGTTATGGQYH